MSACGFARGLGGVAARSSADGEFSGCGGVNFEIYPKKIPCAALGGGGDDATGKDRTFFMRFAVGRTFASGCGGLQQSYGVGISIETPALESGRKIPFDRRGQFQRSRCESQ